MTAPALSIPTPFGRYYAHPARGRQVPSITNIKNVKGIDGLKWWAAREAATYAADNMEKLSHLGREEIITLVKGAPFAKGGSQDNSQAIGNQVHGWIDDYIKGNSAPPDSQPAELASAPRTAQNMWRQFMAFVDRYHPRWVDSEFTVWSEQYGYAGTADWSAEIGGALVLGDSKTGKSVYPDMRYQLSALAHADFILETDGTERPLPKFDRYAILHIRPQSATLVPFSNEAVDAAFAAFLGMLAVFEDDIKYKDNCVIFAPKVQAAR